MQTDTTPEIRPLPQPGPRTSETIAAIAGALAKAQGSYGEVKRDKHAIVTKEGKQGYEYDYADLASVIAAVRPALSANGIAFLQTTNIDGNWAVVTTRLLHASGEWIESISEVPTSERPTPQAIGSAITYARRYGLSSLCGVASEQDDDGQAAGARQDRQQDRRAQQERQGGQGQQRQERRQDDAPRRHDVGDNRPSVNPPPGTERPMPERRPVLCGKCGKEIDIAQRHFTRGDYCYHPECFEAVKEDDRVSQRVRVIEWMLANQHQTSTTYTRKELDGLNDEMLREAYKCLKKSIAEAAQDKAIAATGDAPKQEP